MNSTDANQLRWGSASMVATLALLPFVGVGLLSLSVGRSVGTGIQPAFITGALAVVLSFLSPRDRRGFDADGWLVLAALLWTIAGSAAVWRLDEMGLAGELVWAKSLKQLVQLVFLVALASAPAILLRACTDPWARLRSWERAASIGLLVAAFYGLLQAAAFGRDWAWAAALDRVFTSNPAIASGSGELYLGFRFVGIPRVRAMLCEPLYFGSFLLAVTPVCLAAAVHLRGRARAWRALAAGMGLACLVLTFSRGVYLAAAVQVSAIAVGMITGRLPRPSVRRMLASVVTAVAVLGLTVGGLAGVAPWSIPTLLLQRLQQSFMEHDMSNLTRVYSWRAAWEMAVRAPLGGVGWGAFGFQYYRLAEGTATGAAFGWPVSNSIPLRVLAETGFVGLTLWALALRRGVQGLWARVSRIGQASTTGDRACFILASSVLAVLVQTLTFSQMNLPHLFLVIGVSAAVARERERMV